MYDWCNGHDLPNFAHTGQDYLLAWHDFPYLLQYRWDIGLLSGAKIRQVKKWLDERPTKALGFRTAQQVFYDKGLDDWIVHLKVKSTGGDFPIL